LGERILLSPILLFLLAFPAQATEPFTRGTWATLRAEGPAVVHFWSLTCAPCMAELPRWPALASRAPALRILLVNTDPPDQAAEVERAAHRAGLGALRQLGFADRFAARLRYEVDPDWQGELPRTDLIARDGTVTVVLGALDLAALQHWAKEQAR
jgi:thiol-disulfide isomerase/thioredoxin